MVWVKDISNGDHICFLYNDKRERDQAILDFARAGLAAWAKVACFVSREETDGLRASLGSLTPQMTGLVDKGQVIVESIDNAYRKNGVFATDATLDLLGHEIDSALDAGYSSLWVAGEARFALDCESDLEEMLRYEARVKRLFERKPCVGLCMYDSRLFKPSFLLDTITIHPLILVNGQLIRNTFFHLTDEETSGDPVSMLLEQRIRALCELNSMVENLRMKNELLAEAQRITGVGGWEWDALNRRMHWTDELYRLHGLEPGIIEPGSEEHIQRSLQCYEPEDRPVIMEAFERCATQGIPYDLEFHFTDYMGGKKWIRTTARAVEKNGRVVRVIGNLLDITEQKKRELELKELSEKARRKLDAILEPEGDVSELQLGDIMDPGDLQPLMEDFCSFSGLAMGIFDLEGRILAAAGGQDICMLFHRAHPATRRLCIESDLELSSDVKAGSCKLHKCRNNLWDAAAPILIGNHHIGNIYLGQFLFHDEAVDIDAFREQAMRHGFDVDQYLRALERVPRFSRDEIERILSFHARLASIISSLSYARLSLARALQNMERLAGEIKDRDNQLKGFLDIASHELRHPATLLKGYATLLKRRAVAHDPSLIEEAVEAIDSGTDRLMSIVDQLLDISRIERDMFALEKERVAVEPLVRGVVEEMGALHPERSYSLRIYPQAAYILADYERFRRLLVILLDNATKYSPPETVVELEVAANGGNLTFTVLDRGRGIPEHLREKVFERFFQVDDTLHHSSPGLGIGLFVGRQIAEAHGGRLWHEHREGGGSRFIVSVPMG